MREVHGVLAGGGVGRGSQERSHSLALSSITVSLCAASVCLSVSPMLFFLFLRMNVGISLGVKETLEENI